MQAASCPIASHPQGCRQQVARSKTASWCYTLRGCRPAGCKAAVRKAARHRLHVSGCKAARCKVASRKAACSRLRTPRLQRAQRTGCRLQGCNAASCSASKAAGCKARGSGSIIGFYPREGCKYVVVIVAVVVETNCPYQPHSQPATQPHSHTATPSPATQPQGGGSCLLFKQMI